MMERFFYVITLALILSIYTCTLKVGVFSSWLTDCP
jgi:hypothetical protein